MADIVVLADFPIILTKDAHWRPDQTAKSGSIIRLPADAILVIPKPTKEN